MRSTASLIERIRDYLYTQEWVHLLVEKMLNPAERSISQTLNFPSLPYPTSFTLSPACNSTSCL